MPRNSPPVHPSWPLSLPLSRSPALPRSRAPALFFPPSLPLSVASATVSSPYTLVLGDEKLREQLSVCLTAGTSKQRTYKKCPCLGFRGLGNFSAKDSQEVFLKDSPEVEVSPVGPAKEADSTPI